MRGSRTPTTTAIQLLAAMDHHGVVRAQRQIASKSNEIPAFQPLLDTIDLSGTVLTGDALHTQHGHGAYLIERGAHYLATVKKNHPGLYAQVRKLPWAEIPLNHHTRERAHHRDEIRRLKVAAFRHIDYPGAHQAIQVVRWRRDLATGKLTIERVYLITSLDDFDATPAELAAWIRGHWGIEKRSRVQAGRKVHVIADRHPVHRSKKVTAWLACNRDRIELHLMPGYSPELNPDEILNADIKRHVHPARTRSADDLAHETRRFLHRRQRQPHIVRGYFHARHVRYTIQ
ncbi:ISAs1 family transposase [Streptomyces sp. NPDC005533]|uniref:ISAs1 family transposase n=1 Tax=Streptomyces sp. NPDC005533 TaxID=3364723 RepID=UPI003698CE70